MKFVKPHLPPQELRCGWIVQPGEYAISVWDNQRCQITGAYSLAKCACGEYFCVLFHYHKHMDGCEEVARINEEGWKAANAVLKKANEEAWKRRTKHIE